MYSFGFQSQNKKNKNFVTQTVAAIETVTHALSSRAFSISLIVDTYPLCRYQPHTPSLPLPGQHTLSHMELHMKLEHSETRPWQPRPLSVIQTYTPSLIQRCDMVGHALGSLISLFDFFFTKNETCFGRVKIRAGSNCIQSIIFLSVCLSFFLPLCLSLSPSLTHTTQTHTHTRQHRAGPR